METTPQAIISMLVGAEFKIVSIKENPHSLLTSRQHKLQAVSKNQGQRTAIKTYNQLPKSSQSWQNPHGRVTTRGPGSINVLSYVKSRTAPRFKNYLKVLCSLPKPNPQQSSQRQLQALKGLNNKPSCQPRSNASHASNRKLTRQMS